jgi:hypothetical protein
LTFVVVHPEQHWSGDDDNDDEEEEEEDDDEARVIASWKRRRTTTTTRRMALIGRRSATRSPGKRLAFEDILCGEGQTTCTEAEGLGGSPQNLSRHRAILSSYIIYAPSYYYYIIII